MKRLWTTALGAALACGSDGEPPEDSRPLACEDADYSVCGAPLTASDPVGQPWPTFSQALATLEQCGPDAYPSYRGVCSDGKQYLFLDRLLTRFARYFSGERLVGVVFGSDVDGEHCQCGVGSFLGTLDSIRCAAPTAEPLCSTDPLPRFVEIEFSPGPLSSCSCGGQR